MLTWRSCKLKRAVNSTLVGGLQSLSGSLGEAEWVSLLIRGVVFRDVRCNDWRASRGSVVACLRENCELHQALPAVAVTDSKSA